MTDDRLLELAARVADGREVDWDAARVDRPDLVDEIANLERIAALADRFAPPVSGLTGSGSGLAAAGETWGHLRLVEPIAAGSFGEVWRAFDPVLRREVALKLRRDDADSRASAREFIDEARRLAKVRHPNILGVHGADIHDGRVGLWADLLDGRTLEQAFEAGERFTAARVLETGRDLARALATVHAAGLVHGDVKAANVAIEPDGRAVLMDFGAGVDLASVEHESLSYGSPLSAAPERLEGVPLAASADIWSLGVLLHRLAGGGRYPFEASDVDGLRDLHRRRQAVRSAPPHVPGGRALRRLLERMLDPDPARRPTAAQV
ncbi:MAG: serine/threonine-protein kinase, partial [Candidatus Sulfomarinibacteraceae bacterium]